MSMSFIYSIKRNEVYTIKQRTQIHDKFYENCHILKYVYRKLHIYIYLRPTYPSGDVHLNVGYTKPHFTKLFK